MKPNRRSLSSLGYLLILPFEIHGTLQCLSLVPPSAMFPSFEVAKLEVSWLFQRLNIFRGPAKSPSERLIWLCPLICPWIALRYQEQIQGKIYQYVWAALPKPTNPDRYSLLAAKEDSLTEDTVAGLFDEEDSTNERLHTNVKDQLASDLQSIGRQYQLSIDSALAWLHKPSKFWSRTRLRLASSKSHKDESKPMDEISENSLPRSALANQSESLSGRPHPILPNHSSPPHPSPTGSPSSPSAFHTSSSSEIPSNPSSPRPLALYSNHEDGTVHVNLTIAVPTSDSGPPTMEESTLSPQSPTDSLPAQHATSQAIASSQSDTVSPTPHSNTVPSSYRHERIYHRITALTAHPASSMAHRISWILTGILFVPLDSFYTRSVALSFPPIWAASPEAGMTAASLRAQILSPWTWFGTGLRSGGWSGVRDYVGKMLLIQGVEAGIAMAVWQFGIAGVWYAGHKSCDWGKTLRK